MVFFRIKRVNAYLLTYSSKPGGKWVPSASLDALVENGLAVSTALNLYHYTGIAGFGVLL